MRLSPSALESYRLYRDGDWMPFEQLRDQIMGLRETPQMTLGTGLHEVVEEPWEHIHSDDTYAAESEAFYAPDVDEYLGDLMGPDITREAYGSFMVGDHRIACKCDQLCGKSIIEVKTTEKPIKIDRFLDSIQWRCYLNAFNCDRLVYRVVQLRKYDIGYCIDDCQELELWRYPRMFQDIKDLVYDYVQFLEVNDLTKYHKGNYEYEKTS